MHPVHRSYNSQAEAHEQDDCEAEDQLRHGELQP